MRDLSESLNLLFKNEQRREERRERFTFGHKKGEKGILKKLSKTYEKYEFLFFE